MDFMTPHSYYYYKPTTPTTKATLPTTIVVQKKINPNSPSAIMLLREETENYCQMGRTKIHVGTGMILGETTKVGPLFQ